jgi:hypothetical protein
VLPPPGAYTVATFNGGAQVLQSTRDDKGGTESAKNG